MPRKSILIPGATLIVGTIQLGGPSWAQPADIAFTSDRDGNLEVYVMRQDGSSQANLTRNPSRDWLADWSPDGQFLVFQTDRDGNDEVYVMNVDGSGLRNLTQRAGYEGSPIWSPHGDLIAFNSDRDGGINIYTMRPDGSDVIRRTYQGVGGYVVDWSSDGKSILHHDFFCNWEVFLLDLGSGNESRLTNNCIFDAEPTWSRNGKLIAFTTERDGNKEIYVMNPDGSSPFRVTHDPAADDHPVWTRNGKEIVFGSSRDGNAEIYRMNVDGSSPINLTNHPGDDLFPRLR